MLKHYTGLLALISIAGSLVAQQSVDGNFPFQTDPAKRYALYIPSDYVEGSPHRLMLGMHPFNTSRWDATSWRDTLIVFAEENSLLLVCPDAGTDGSLDDSIDTAFTSALLDSVATWYSIDTGKVYIMGFSVGGRMTYTYGLARPSIFKGYLPIGSAITNLNEVTAPLQANSNGKPVFIVHGSLDAPSTRFVPVREALLTAGANLRDTLLAGVGHTIDFPNRNSVLTMAYQWIDSVNCAASEPVDTTSTGFGLPAAESWTAVLHPNLIKPGQRAWIDTRGDPQSNLHWVLSSLDGSLWARGMAAYGRTPLPVDGLPEGIYLVQLSAGKASLTRRLVIIR